MAAGTILVDLRNRLDRFGVSGTVVVSTRRIENVPGKKGGPERCYQHLTGP